MTPAQRRKALAGRVLELTGGAKLGKGEKAVREAERNKAAARVRLGIVEKQHDREKQQLEEVNYLLYTARKPSNGFCRPRISAITIRLSRNYLNLRLALVLRSENETEG